MKSVQATGRASGFGGGLAIATFSALVVTLLLAAVLAFFVSREVVAQEDMGYGIMGILFLSAFICGSVAYSKIRHRRALVYALSAITYFVSLTAATALFFGGQFEGIFPTAMLIIGGSGLGLFISVRPERRKKQEKSECKIVKMHKSSAWVI